MTKKPDPTYLKELFEEHLPYEVYMMRYAYGNLQLKMDQAATNAYIEVFCLHVRNLLEFLGKNTTYSAHAFSVPGWKSFDGVPRTQLRAVHALLNNQISHLAANQRTSDPNKKIGGAERDQMLLLIETELERLRGGLSSGWQASWSRATVTPTTQPSATNAIGVF